MTDLLHFVILLLISPIITHQRQRFYEAVDVGVFGRLYDLLHRDVPCVVPIGNVVLDTAAKQHGFLEHDTNLSA